MITGRPGHLRGFDYLGFHRYSVTLCTHRRRVIFTNATVVRLVSKYLGPPNGRRLLDIAAGTANYTRVMQARGFDVLAVDAEFEMVSRSVGKIGSGDGLGCGRGAHGVCPLGVVET